MKRFIRNAVDPLLRPLGRRLLNLHDVPRRLDAHETALRVLGAAEMRQRYAELVPAGAFRSLINDHEYRVFSQHGEDGILLHIFSKIGVTNRRFVEFGVEDGTECNAANLAIHFGFSGLLMDGDEAHVERGHRFYRAMLGDDASRVMIARSWVTVENINKTIRDHGIEGEIDLLSIDIDGNDYWLWKAIDVVQPRVVVIEYNAAFGPDRNVSIPYNPEFNRWQEHESGFYFGASLSALTQLGAQNGYTLIGCERSGNNAFFVRDDVIDGHFQAMTPSDAFFEMADRVGRGYPTERQAAMIAHLPVVDV